MGGVLARGGCLLAVPQPIGPACLAGDKGLVPFLSPLEGSGR